jgi:hypothetical protein
MIAFSYRVSPSNSDWYWELKAPDSSVTAFGVAPSDVAARVAAIRAALMARLERGEQSSPNKH